MHGDCTDKKRVAELFKWLASAKDEKFDQYKKNFGRLAVNG